MERKKGKEYMPLPQRGEKENDTGQPCLYPSNVVQAFRPDNRQTF